MQRSDKRQEQEEEEERSLTPRTKRYRNEYDSVTRGRSASASPAQRRHNEQIRRRNELRGTLGSSPAYDEENEDERSRWRRERESTYRQEYQNIRRRQEDRRSEGREEDSWGHRQRETNILRPRYEHREEVEKRKALLVARERVQEREDEDWLQVQAAKARTLEEHDDGDDDMSGQPAAASTAMVNIFDINRSHDTLAE